MVWLDRVARKLARAERPLVVTSYLGRNPRAVPVLQRLAEMLGLGVLESAPSALNFPTSHPLYQGNQWNHPFQNPSLAEADCILVVDSDVPWIPTVSRPRAGVIIHHIDVDALKAQMPLWYIPAVTSHDADAEVALGQILAAAEHLPLDPARIAASTAAWQRLHDARAGRLACLEADRTALTGEIVTAAVRAFIDDTTIVLNEGISHYHTIIDHLGLDRPGAIHASGGGSLGWHGGAAIGAKLAAPDATVVALTGDGSYMFSVPSSVHWMARRYGTPFLTVVYNNGGWKSPKLSTLAVHPDGLAARGHDIGVSFDPPADYAGIAAAAGGALAFSVRTVEELDTALALAFPAVRRDGRSAVIDAHVTPL